MKERRCIIGQSGGPTVTINATLAGVIEKAYKENFEKVYGMIHGIEGLLQHQIIELIEFKDSSTDTLMNTPAMYLGSCRYKLPENDEILVQKIFTILEEYQITDFFYIGGNDSMDTIKKLNQYAKKIDSTIHFIGIPKTIDNDLLETEYTPGYPSACQFVITALSEIVLDSTIYPIQSVTIVEVMGRDAGWLTASAQLVNEVYEQAIDLIYMPEIIFDEEAFIIDVKARLLKKDHVIIAVSEGIKNKDGNSISIDAGIQTDAFGHTSNSGCSTYLKNIILDTIGCKTKAIQLGILQRCSAHIASKVDLKNAKTVGQVAVTCALKNQTGIMMTIRYHNNQFVIASCQVENVANKVKIFPLEWIDIETKQIKKGFVDYVIPLVYPSKAIELPKYHLRTM